VKNQSPLEATPYHRPRTNKIPILILSIILLILTAGFIIYYFQSASTIWQKDQIITSLQADVASLNFKVKSLDIQNTSLNSQVQVIQSDKVGLESQVTSLTSINQTISNQVTGLQSELKSSADQVDSLQGDLQSSTNRVQLLNNQITGLDTQVKELTTQVNTTASQLKLYKDTFGSSVTSGVSPMANGQSYGLNSNPNASDPTWDQLRNFIISDQTDMKPYIPGVYVCTDYARDVYNNSEKAGIKAGWVGIDFKNQTVGHACNVFKTTDRGLVYIDCSGLPANLSGPSNRDKIVTVKLNQDYIPQCLVYQLGWSSTWEDLGTVQDVQIFW
jgi:chaperonin cofactor prefoldin